MGRRVTKTRGGGRYTEAGYFGFIRSGLRQKSMRWPPKYDVMNAAKRPYDGPDKRRKFEYLCNGCKYWHAGLEVLTKGRVLRRFWQVLVGAQVQLSP